MSEHLETNDIPLSLSCNMSHTILRRWDGEHFILKRKNTNILWFQLFCLKYVNSTRMLVS